MPTLESLRDKLRQKTLVLSDATDTTLKEFERAVVADAYMNMPSVVDTVTQHFLETIVGLVTTEVAWTLLASTNFTSPDDLLQSITFEVLENPDDAGITLTSGSSSVDFNTVGGKITFEAIEGGYLDPVFAVTLHDAYAAEINFPTVRVAATYKTNPA